MQVSSLLPLLALLVWSLICAIGDARERRIANSLVLKGALCVALYVAIYRQSFTGEPLMGIALGVLAALLCTLPGYWLGKLGAGDVKMLAVVGFATGSTFVLYTVVGAACAVLLWALLAPALWPGLSGQFKTRFPALAPPLDKLPYAPFLFLGMCVASIAALVSP